MTNTEPAFSGYELPSNTRKLESDAFEALDKLAKASYDGSISASQSMFLSDTIRQALEAALTEESEIPVKDNEWMSIESAPKNTDPPIMGYNSSWDCPKLICFKETYTLEMCWHEYDGMPLPHTPHCQPTHWMPLPQPPKSEG